jgi:riboflavin transporter FmnP
MIEILGKENLYYSLAGVLLIVFSYFFTKYFWKWWKEVKNTNSIDRSNAIQGVAGGVVFFIIGLMFLYYSFILPFYNWLRN